MHTLSSILIVLSITGNVLVNRRDWKGQFLWVIANAGWIYVDAKAGLYEQAALFGVYLVIAIWGMKRWKQHAQESRQTL